MKKLNFCVLILSLAIFSVVLAVRSVEGSDAFVIISGGNGHSLGVKSDGTVWAWGYNFYGQLGDGTNTDKYVPVQVSGLTGIVSVSANLWHSLALRSDGTVWAWGRNNTGQLGDGTTSDRNVPVRVPLRYVVAIDAGAGHSLALQEDGTVWAWGSNGFGQLGDGTTTPRKFPVKVVTSLGGPPLTEVVSVSGGDVCSFALKSDGTVWAWGHNYFGQLGDGTNTDRYVPVQVVTSLGGLPLTGIVSISSYWVHCLALRSDGTVWAWGGNSVGQLGDGTTTDRNIPAQVSGLTDVVSVSADYNFSLALRSDGTVRAWGGNSVGQLGDGTNTERHVPVQVVTSGGAPLTGIVSVYANAGCSFGLGSDGTVWAWGANPYGGLGDGTTTNRNLPVQSMFTLYGEPPGIKAVSTRLDNSLGLKSDGTVWVWGVGWGFFPAQVLAYLPGPPLKGIKAVSAGGDHFLALKTDGTVWAWGRNDWGQLGNGNYPTEASFPVQVLTPAVPPLPRPPLKGIKAVSAGTNHSLALKTDGTVWAWGANHRGQLGNGTNLSRDLPVQVSGLTGVVAIAAGHWHSLALRSDGTVWSWGWNEFGQLGDGTTTDSNVPVQVVTIFGTPLTGIKSVSVGCYDHSLALKTDGTVWAWGHNHYCQLGDGTNMDRYVPVQVVTSGVGGPPLLGIKSVTAGAGHSLAVKIDGTVWAWGYNFYGQLGDGTTINRNLPVKVLTSLSGPPLLKIKSVTAGSRHSLALKSDGTVWAWGENWFAQLGVGVAGFEGGLAQSPLALMVDSSYTPAGNNLWVDLFEPFTVTAPPVPPAAVFFDTITSHGTTSLTTSTTGESQPSGFKLGDPPLYYEISTTADYSGGIRVCIHYAGISFDNEMNVRLLHKADGATDWMDITVSIDTLYDIVCGDTTSLSPFVIAERFIGPITGPDGPVPLGTAVSVNASVYIEASSVNSFEFKWDWGDGSGLTDADMTPDEGGYKAGGVHMYSQAGVYTVKLRAFDNSTGSEVASLGYQFVVVYDPFGGFVTGGGWIISPAGAYTLEPSLTGKATFGFVSKYQKGSSIPTGKTEFEFQVANFYFCSTAYDWLVIAGAKAQFKGTGTVDGSGDYGFMLTAVDGQISGGGGLDKFRIKIWDRISDTIVYDNQLEESDDTDPTTVIGGGSIVIHNK